MDGFKGFLESAEEEKDVKDTLKKVPESYRNLIKGYKFVWQPGNTLKNDDGHVGKIDPVKKTITVSAPYFYGREFVILHELGHKIYERLPPAVKKEWAKIVKLNPKRKKSENDEENFCFGFANYYSKHKNLTYNHPQWMSFMKRLPQ